MRVLMIDDEPVFYKMSLKVLTDKGYEVEYASNGKDGLNAVASFEPEIIIVDMRMPDMNGIDILRKLRLDPRHIQTPVIFVTSVKTLEDKLKAFELGADDYLIKPFEPEELAARLDIVSRRAKVLLLTSGLPEAVQPHPNIVAVHSLRGGSGVSSLAVNLALSFSKIWEKPSLIIDTALFSSQVAMLLNMSPGSTLGKIANFQFSDIDDEVIDGLIESHISGLDVIAAPRFPVATDIFNEEFWSFLFRRVNDKYAFIVIDTPHDFSDVVISSIMKADTVVLVVSPEMASLRVTVSALRTYEQIGIPSSNIKLVLNNNFSSAGIDREKIQKAIGRQFNFELPYDATEVLRAVNLGSPFVLSNPDLMISRNIEDMAYSLSSEILKNIPPAAPSKAWKRVTSRLSGGHKKT